MNYYSMFLSDVDGTLVGNDFHLPEICIQIFTEKGIYRMRSNWMIENHGVKEEMGKEIFSAGQAQGDILKLSFTANHRTILEKCRNLPLWKGRRYEYSSKHFTEVTSEQTGKHVAAAHLMEVLGAKKEKIFAAGNGMNDLSMLKMGALLLRTERCCQTGTGDKRYFD